MKIGYPCINYSLKCSPNKTLRLKNFNEKRVIEIINNNLNCLLEILNFNKNHEIFFFRISSETIPFASHEIMNINWREYFKDSFLKIGEFIKNNNIRVSMHPDQFILINSIREDVYIRSIKELEYHAIFLDSLELDESHKIQIHVGGVYNNKNESIERFIIRYEKLPQLIKKRLVIENDDKFYNILDCILINKKIGIPIVFDYFHFNLNNLGENLNDVLPYIINSWNRKDGIAIFDYSSQENGKKFGTHANKIDLKDFENFIKLTRPYDFDIMLEIKDKEKSAIKAINHLKKLNILN
jgi:UV DNA damage endonuclease